MHANFFASLLTYASHENAELIVVEGHYKNPTRKVDEELWWDHRVIPYLTDKRRKLCPNLSLFADINVQPTAANPLTRFNVLLGSSSGIIAHPKRALECVPTSTRIPRVLATTGACTVENYSESKAGATGVAHHVIGALVVDICADGTYLLRQVTSDKKGNFVDLATRYTPNGVRKAPRAKSLTLGDIHVGREEASVVKATRELAKLISPEYLVLHDLLDGVSRNHHDRGMRPKYAKRNMKMSDEVINCAKSLGEFSKLAKHVRVVRSNHDEALEKFCDNTNVHDDPISAPYWHELWSRAYAHFDKHGTWPDLLALECKRLGIPANIKFLGLDESLLLSGVEHGFHGHLGLNGSRGSIVSFEKLGCKVNIGHSHTPGIRGGAYQAGVYAGLDHEYNHKPSTWAHAHIITHQDGKRQLCFIVSGKFRAETVKKKPSVELSHAA